MDNTSKTIVTRLIGYLAVGLLQFIADRTDNDLDDSIVNNIRDILGMGDTNGR
ncbi:MAG: hypothetical protein ACRC92_21665 [Peptostreptococcaceae bacterium]